MKFNGRFYLGKNVELGKNVKIGDNTVIYDNVHIGDDTIITNDCVIGEPTKDYYLNDNYVNPITAIGSDSLIRSHSIIYSDSKFGNKFETGHRVTIREKSKFGNNCMIGTLSDIQGHVEFGEYCRLHSNVHIGKKSKIGNFVFIYPYVVLTNDPTPPSNNILGPFIDDYTQIGTYSVIMPGIKVAKNCLIAAASVVTNDVEEFSLIIGNPGKKVKDVRQIRSRGKKGFHYPWMYNFDRGMPWQGKNYDNWIKEQ